MAGTSRLFLSNYQTLNCVTRQFYDLDLSALRDQYNALLSATMPSIVKKTPLYNRRKPSAKTNTMIAIKIDNIPIIIVTFFIFISLKPSSWFQQTDQLVFCKYKCQLPNLKH